MMKTDQTSRQENPREAAPQTDALAAPAQQTPGTLAAPAESQPLVTQLQQITQKEGKVLLAGKWVPVDQVPHEYARLRRRHRWIIAEFGVLFVILLFGALVLFALLTLLVGV